MSGNGSLKRARMVVPNVDVFTYYIQNFYNTGIDTD
jgi:hypothetical protein